MPPKPRKKTGKSPISSKGPSSKEMSSEDRLIDTALSLASTQGWSLTTIRDIAGEAGVALAEFYDIFDGKNDLVAAYGRRLDRKLFEAFDEINPETPTRDLIFDILMERFDLANPDKIGLKSILESYRADPRQIMVNLPGLTSSVARMLEIAGLDASGWKGSARIAGLTGILAYTTKIWLDDTSPDLTKTMAALDKALSRIENFADRFNL